ncbi:MAG: histidine phosphatase family protein [Acetobacter okinawensis]|uniref:histidine phosphatase family protein n=1 Tax=Acetobacter okinawensis TaxID=1076594 RepID=UPI0039ECD4BD
MPPAVSRGELPGGADVLATGFDLQKAAAYLPATSRLTLHYAPDVAAPDVDGPLLFSQNALRDRDYGLWAGRNLRDVGPEEQLSFLSDVAFAPPGGESFAASYQRMAHWLDVLEQTVPAAVVLARPACVRNLILRVLYPGENPVSMAHAARVDVLPHSYSLLTCHAGRWRVGMLSAPM